MGRSNDRLRLPTGTVTFPFTDDVLGLVFNTVQMGWRPDLPPRSNPPRRSSSGPPSPCMTPSTVIIVVMDQLTGSGHEGWQAVSRRSKVIWLGHRLSVAPASVAKLLGCNLVPRLGA